MLILKIKILTVASLEDIIVKNFRLKILINIFLEAVLFWNKKI
jgi:hypothetical protein